MYNKELSIAIKAVKASEPTFRKYFGTKTKVEIKHGNYRDLVSYADKKIEQDIKKYLLSHFPSYGFIGEESGKTKSNSKFSWVLDPIDGTTNYLQGINDCCISLALLKDGKPVVGVIDAPMIDKLYTASIEKGARLNNKKITVSKITDLSQALGGIGWGRDINFGIKLFPKLLPSARKLRIPSSTALGLCYVAQGVYDFFFTKSMELWDYAAGKIITEEAGGRFIETKKIQIAANAQLAAKLHKLF